ncbi:hypothetical protein F503_00024 [Ophiostoma piceae UAMH 11346]|uniref:Uncharacterized protein n=1 Tax=Ophiostoma piceae (strain UAMH 11346) TaxID=1262450 RepID=S3CVR5_OPHP1|nr:hypothetical protein F503_00024 [Ophiostoma piceae UAMH 11346]
MGSVEEATSTEYAVESERRAEPEPTKPKPEGSMPQALRDGSDLDSTAEQLSAANGQVEKISVGFAGLDSTHRGAWDERRGGAKAGDERRDLI